MEGFEASLAERPAKAPLANYALFQTRDLDEARERVAAVFCPHRLDRIGDGGRRGIDSLLLIGTTTHQQDTEQRRQDEMRKTHGFTSMNQGPD